eukprot:15486009-Heterocapsa_arctica.AAC.1
MGSSWPSRPYSANKHNRICQGLDRKQNKYWVHPIRTLGLYMLKFQAESRARSLARAHGSVSKNQTYVILSTTKVLGVCPDLANPKANNKIWRAAHGS